MYSGVYLTYVSEKVKERLREHVDECVELDVIKIFQLINPGDGMIQDFKSIQLASPMPDFESMEGVKVSVERLELTTHPSLDEQGKLVVSIRLKNASDEPVLLMTDWLTPTLLVPRSPDWQSNDGPSVATITRISFWAHDGTYEGKPNFGETNEYWSWQVIYPKTFDKELVLPAKKTFELRVRFTRMPKGEYDFLLGYGDRVYELIVPTPIAFDIDEQGKATLVEVEGRE